MKVSEQDLLGMADLCVKNAGKGSCGMNLPMCLVCGRRIKYGVDMEDRWKESEPMQVTNIMNIKPDVDLDYVTLREVVSKAVKDEITRQTKNR